MAALVLGRRGGRGGRAGLTSYSGETSVKSQRPRKLTNWPCLHRKRWIVCLVNLS